MIRVYTDDHVRPESWMRGAMCAQIGGDDWFPKHGDLPTAERAKRICREACPVQAQCLEFALRTGQSTGIWAGYSAKSLQAIRRRGAA
ncbi:WhiB family transcriptional regulator [Microbacterium paraoxydans]|uniref:WhiB family transcriptional regulator n=2 Tax=Microbacteriaceae TaxID=85023 RepID=UPI0037C8E424